VQSRLRHLESRFRRQPSHPTIVDFSSNNSASLPQPPMLLAMNQQPHPFLAPTNEQLLAQANNSYQQTQASFPPQNPPPQTNAGGVASNVSFYMPPQHLAGSQGIAMLPSGAFTSAQMRGAPTSSQVLPQFQTQQYFDNYNSFQAQPGYLQPPPAYMPSHYPATPQTVYAQPSFTSTHVSPPRTSPRGSPGNSPPRGETGSFGKPAKVTEKTKSKLHRKLEGVDETLFSSFKLRTKTRRPTTRSVTMPVIDTKLCSALEEFIKDYQLRNLPFFIPAREEQDLSLLTQLLRKWQLMTSAPISFQEGAALLAHHPPGQALGHSTSPLHMIHHDNNRPSTPPPNVIPFYPPTGMPGSSGSPPGNSSAHGPLSD